MSACMIQHIIPHTLYSSILQVRFKFVLVYLKHVSSIPQKGFKLYFKHASSMLYEEFKLLQLPSPDEGLVYADAGEILFIFI